MDVGGVLDNHQLDAAHGDVKLAHGGTAVFHEALLERWSAAIIDLWQEKGLLTRAEVEAKMSEIKKRLEG